eukprot:scaffold670595_cov94-Prasinocladus_malaysianus.AAC.1
MAFSKSTNTGRDTKLFQDIVNNMVVNATKKGTWNSAHFGIETCGVTKVNGTMIPKNTKVTRCVRVFLIVKKDICKACKNTATHKRA